MVFFHFSSSLLLALSLASDLRLRAARMAADGASNNVSVDLDDLVQLNVKDEPCKSWSNDANEPIDIDGEKEFTQVTNGRKRGPPENGSSPSDRSCESI